MNLQKLQRTWLILASSTILIAIGVVVFVMPGWKPAAPQLGNHLIVAALLSALPALVYHKAFFAQAKDDLLQQLRGSTEQSVAALGTFSQKMFYGAGIADLPFFMGASHAFMTGTEWFMIIMAVASLALKVLFKPPSQPA